MALKVVNEKFVKGVRIFEELDDKPMNLYPDKLFVGTPSTGGFEIYVDMRDLEGTKVKIENAKALLKYAKEV